MDKSPDAFRTISEVADLLETPAHVLRFWESRFPQIRPVKRAGGRRYYRPTDVALLAGIRLLLHVQGMTIRGVQKILREQGVRHVCGLADTQDLIAEAQQEWAGDDLEGVAVELPPPPVEDRVIPWPGPRPRDEGAAQDDGSAPWRPEVDARDDSLPQGPDVAGPDEAGQGDDPPQYADAPVADTSGDMAPEAPAAPVPPATTADPFADLPLFRPRLDSAAGAVPVADPETVHSVVREAGQEAAAPTHPGADSDTVTPAPSESDLETEPGGEPQEPPAPEPQRAPEAELSPEPAPAPEPDPAPMAAPAPEPDAEAGSEASRAESPPPAPVSLMTPALADLLAALETTPEVGAQPPSLAGLAARLRAVPPGHLAPEALAPLGRELWALRRQLDGTAASRH